MRRESEVMWGNKGQSGSKRNLEVEPEGSTSGWVWLYGK